MKRMNGLMNGVMLSVAALVLVACASGPVKDPSTERARAALTRLQSEPDLASRAPVAINEAELAVSAAEKSDEAAAAAQLGYLAEKKVEIARSLAERRLAEDQAKMTTVERERIRLAARTREADVAIADAERSKEQAEISRQQAGLAMEQTDIAKQQTGEANMAAEQARLESEDLKRQMLDLNAKITDRGMVLTLGDVLFAAGQADLKPGATARLGKLITFLNKYPDRTATIEGHTDNVGSEGLNQTLSLHRAQAVKTYLVSQGIASDRISATGMGESLPVASNGNSAGRQQNRRVEIIIGRAN
jgi:outer membrane protein OmpA-like peptidoglycan-associated protein